MEQDLQSSLASWRKAEDKYYGSVMSAPELYTASIRLVRGIADSLGDIDNVEALLGAYPQMSISQVADVADALEITHRDFLDYHLARDAAFYLRHREILETRIKTKVQARIAEAQARDEEWVTLYNNEQPGQGVTFFQRLEMHLPDGIGIYSAIELDWEKGRVYVVEPLMLDPATGEPRREVRPPDFRQEFTTGEELIAAVAALRQKYSDNSEKKLALLSHVKSKTYQDSVRLMHVSETLSNLNQVKQAIVAMGTDANKRVLVEVGLITDEVEQAGPNDLVIVIEAESGDAAQDALAQAEAILVEAAGSKKKEQQEITPRTLEQAHNALAGANMTLISVPGPHAKVEAAKAINAGMHVFLFSDNVSLEEELSLKKWAVSKGLLMMGPGCGTAIINGVALAFANVIRRGPVGVVGASGTGLQEVTSLIDRGGMGISQAIGVGGRDLSEKIGGLMMLQGISMLTNDPQTEVIVLISKPPAESVTERVLKAARAGGKPVVVNFLGSERTGEENGLIFTTTIENTAEVALQQVNNNTDTYFSIDAAELNKLADAERQQLSSEQKYLRGLFSGGSLCDEAMDILHQHLPGVYSNIPLSPEYALEDAWQSKKHSCIDMGEEEFTLGRPHPMIDPRLRQERILKEAEDPTVSVILLDVVIGHGSHANPAGALGESIQAAKAYAAGQGRHLSVVAHVCGTDQDPQGLQRQEEILRDAGVLVLPTNAQATRVAAAIVS